MNREFIPYQIALDMKSIGFDEPCLANYNNGGILQPVMLIEKQNTNNHFASGGYFKEVCTAPTFSQCFRWFREKYGIQATIEPTKDQHRFELGFNYWIWDTKTGEEWFTEPKDRPSGDYVFDNYEEAELACLIKLIEIVKNQTKN
jgi:hypothetical protein